MSLCFKQLVETVFRCSKEKEHFFIACMEWEIIKHETGNCHSCVCGHEGIVHLYTIRNCVNGNTLYPIGSICIKKFNNSNMTETMKMLGWGDNLYNPRRKNEIFAGKTFKSIVDNTPWYVKYLIDTGVGGKNNNKTLVKYFHFINHFNRERE